MLENPLTLGCGLTIPNRLAKAATTEALATADHQVGDAMHRLYARWGRSGAGLLVTGNVGIDPMHPVRPGDAMVLADSPREPLKKWASLIRAEGTRAILQICHAGRQTQRWANPHPIAPSAVKAVKTLKAFGEPRAATEAEIEELRERFVTAALIGEEVGFDGCQIHSAHGYLLNQFLSPLSNQRTDRWGGPIENRARLLLEIVREVKRRRRSTGYAVTVKLNSCDFQRGGLSEGDAMRVVGLLEAEGIDLLEISGGNYEAPASFGRAVGQSSSSADREAYFLAFVRKARRVTRVPLMLTGGWRSRVAMESALREGAVDLIGVARPFCLEPELGRRMLADPDARMVLRERWPGPRAIAPFGEMAFYSEQLQRMGRGLPPNPRMSVLRAMATHFCRDAWRGTRRPRHAPEAAPVLALN